MILTDCAIRDEIRSGRLVVEPLDDSQIGPASVDLRLGSTFLVPKLSTGIISMADPIDYESTKGDEFIIPAHGFVLATTAERVGLPSDLTAFVEGRSSVGRLGLFIQNAGWVDPGFYGMITLELYNANNLPMRITAGRRICQLVLARAVKPAEKPYSGKYQGQIEATGSRIFMDAEVGRDE